MVIAWALLLGFPVAAAFGWWMGYRSQRSRPNSKSHLVHTQQRALQGLTLLAYEQAAEAEDVLTKLVKTHPDLLQVRFALAGLYRRQGFLERAIDTHQAILNSKGIPSRQRVAASLELARDYMAFGLLDRAEELLQRLIAQSVALVPSLKQLLKIYEQTKEWRQGLVVAKRLKKLGSPVSAVMAHYHCELAQEALARSDQNSALACLQNALIDDPDCVRAVIMQGKLAVACDRVAKAVAAFSRVLNYYPRYVAEIIGPLYSSYQSLGREHEFIDELKERQESAPQLSVAIVIANHLRCSEGVDAAMEYVAEELNHFPALQLLRCAMMWALQMDVGRHLPTIRLWQEVVERMMVKEASYQCALCGYLAPSLYWRCPACAKWAVVSPSHDMGKIRKQAPVVTCAEDVCF